MEEPSTRGRDLVIAVGGPLQAGENRKSWLARVAASVGVSCRVAAAAFYGEQLSRNTRLKLKLKAGEHESQNLACRIDDLLLHLPHRPDCDVATVDALRRATVALRRMAAPRRGGGAALVVLATGAILRMLA